MSDGGSAQPVGISTGTQQGGAAIPVVVVPDGYPLQGGPAQAVYEVTSGLVRGGPALPVYAAASGVPVTAGPAIPVYVVSGSLNPTPPISDAVIITEASDNLVTEGSDLLITE